LFIIFFTFFGNVNICFQALELREREEEREEERERKREREEEREREETVNRDMHQQQPWEILCIIINSRLIPFLSENNVNVKMAFIIVRQTTYSPCTP
jgi:flagellar biosynthesis component FlhA